MSVEEAVSEIEDGLVIHRAERFVLLGFDADDSFDLAQARGLDGFHLYWGDVKKMMDNGATKPQILAIFL